MIKCCKMSYLYYLYWSNLQYKPNLYEKDHHIHMQRIVLEILAAHSEFRFPNTGKQRGRNVIR